MPDYAAIEAANRAWWQPYDDYAGDQLPDGLSGLMAAKLNTLDLRIGGLQVWKPTGALRPYDHTAPFHDGSGRSHTLWVASIGCLAQTRM